MLLQKIENRLVQVLGQLYSYLSTNKIAYTLFGLGVFVTYSLHAIVLFLLLSSTPHTFGTLEKIIFWIGYTFFSLGIFLTLVDRKGIEKVEEQKERFDDSQKTKKTTTIFWFFDLTILIFAVIFKVSSGHVLLFSVWFSIWTLFLFCSYFYYAQNKMLYT